MPTPKVLDNLDTLLAPISPDHPAGEELSYDLKGQLDQLRKEIKNPDHPEEDKDPDWSGIIKLTTEALTKTTKHCRLAARLTEALVQQGHGYAGLRDGLTLMRRLVGECWDRLQPVIPAEEGEDRTDALDFRLSDFRWLDDPNRGALFPNTVRMVPIFGNADRFSIMEMKGAREKKGSIPWADFEKAIRDTSPAAIQNAIDDTGESLRELDQLVRNLQAKLAWANGVELPAMTGLRDAVQECHTLLQQIQKEFFPRAPAAAGNGAVVAGAGAAPPAVEAPPPKKLATREDALRQMEEAAELMRRLEPHSPIPYLVERAITLGKLPFPQLMKELIQEQKVLADLFRLVGIKEEKKT